MLAGPFSSKHFVYLNRVEFVFEEGSQKEEEKSKQMLVFYACVEMEKF